MALIKCPECGKEVSSMAKSCPNCGCPIDSKITDDNHNCSHCQEPDVAVVQHHRNGRNSLIAMSICIFCTILFIISDCYNGLVSYKKYISLPTEVYTMWCNNHETELIIFNLIAAFSSLCVIIAWLIWFLRGKNKNISFIVGTIICCALLLVKTLRVIPNTIWFDLFNSDMSTFYEFLSYHGIINSLLSLALGISLFFMKCNGKVKKLTVTVGVFFVIYNLKGCIFSVLEIAHIEHPITDTVFYVVIDYLFYYILLTTTIILFYNTHKQENVSGSQHRIEQSQQKTTLKSSTKAKILTFLILAILSLFVWVALVPRHSKTYNEYMSRIKAREAAINRATSLFDMKKLDERILSLGADEYLTDGDERRAVVTAHDRAWRLFSEKCEQLAVGKYKLTTIGGQTYIIELTNKKESDVYPYSYFANIYKDNKLYSKGEWWCSEANIGIHHTLITEEHEWNYKRIDIHPDMNTYTLKWYGKIEKEKTSWGYDWREDKGTVEKIL